MPVILRGTDSRNPVAKQPDSTDRPSAETLDETQARLKNGTKITRTTDKGYCFAWYAFGHYKDRCFGSNYGFASTEEKARKAANAELRHFSHTPCGVEVVKVSGGLPARR